MAVSLKDPAKYREYQRAYRAAHRHELAAYFRQWRIDNPAYFRTKRHGADVDDAFAAMWEAQDGRCYLCGEEMAIEDAAIEHDHSCCPRNRSCRICRRGLAHTNCNSAAGLVGDDPQRLRRMADALEAAQAAVESRKAAMSEQLILDIS